MSERAMVEAVAKKWFAHPELTRRYVSGHGMQRIKWAVKVTAGGWTFAKFEQVIRERGVRMYFGDGDGYITLRHKPAPGESREAFALRVVGAK